MRFKSIEKLRIGDKVGMDVCDLAGRNILAKGIVLNESMLNKLKEQGFTGIYVDDYISHDVYVKPVITQALSIQARECVKEGDIDKLIDCSKSIVKDVMQNGVISIDMSVLKEFDDFTYAHSVNVAIIACVMGMYMRLSDEDLGTIVLASLLRDIGKCKIPLEILNKPDKLTKEEYDLVKTHSTLSYEMIIDRPDISSTVKNAVLLHHENEDGSGYPMGISGNNLSVPTKIIHVADIYDALISDKPYKSGNTPTEAVEYLMGACGVLFDRKIVDVFIKCIPLYQKGAEVVLSNGERAIIIENTGKHSMRPRVRLMSTGRDIDLIDREFMAISFQTVDQIDKEKKKERDALAAKESKNLKKRILIVDDMKMNRILLRGILEKKYELTYAESGGEAIAAVGRDMNFDLIIMDIDMPGISGLDAAAEINKITNLKIPILFVTSVNNLVTVIKCRELHAAGYITRPYNMTYVQTEVDRIIYTAF